MNARLGSERRRSTVLKSSTSHRQSQSHGDVDAASAQSDTSSTSSRPTSAASSHAKLEADSLRASADVKSERSSSRASDHYSEEFDEPSVASSHENLDMTVPQPTKAKKSPPS